MKYLDKTTCQYYCKKDILTEENDIVLLVDELQPSHCIKALLFDRKKKNNGEKNMRFKIKKKKKKTEIEEINILNCKSFTEDIHNYIPKKKVSCSKFLINFSI